MNWSVLLLHSLFGLLAAVSGEEISGDGRKCGQQPGSMTLFTLVISDRDNGSLSLVVQDCLSEIDVKYHGRIRHRRFIDQIMNMFTGLMGGGSGGAMGFMQFLQPMINMFMQFIGMFMGGAGGLFGGGGGGNFEVETLNRDQRRRLQDRVLDRLTAFSRMTHISERDFLRNAQKYVQTHRVAGNKTVMLSRIEELQNRLEENEVSTSFNDRAVRFREIMRPRRRSSRRRSSRYERSISSNPIACLDKCVMTKIGLEFPGFGDVQWYAERQGFSREMMEELRICFHEKEEMGCNSLESSCQEFSRAAECLSSVVVKHWSPLLLDLEVEVHQ